MFGGCRSKILFLLLLFTLICSWSAGPALALEQDLTAEEAAAERSRKTLLLNLGLAGGILTWGVINWDYFQTTPRVKQEYWFGQRTKEGGADKFGHMFSTYALSQGLSALYLHWGYSQEEATRLGLYSSLGAVTLMELGDSFSDEFGFSYEDMVVNLAGAGLSYLSQTYPEFDRKFDFRVEYLPEFGSDFQGDVFTDYQHMKYLFALKGDGFEATQETFLKYLELQFGYYARDYDDFDEDDPPELDDRARYVYAAVGLNVGKLLENWVKVPVFDYLQVPYTYLPVTKRLDKD